MHRRKIVAAAHGMFDIEGVMFLPHMQDCRS